MSFDRIPKELRERDQWLMWDSSADTPRRPHWRGDFGISWSDPEEWHTFEEAVEAANERDSWGIGYVTALDNDDHARGLYGVIDIDGGNREAGEEKLKEWVPSLEPFVEDGAYVEFSPSGEGLHIPFVGHRPPEWWADCQLGEHEGVDVLTNKFCTFTGDVASVSGSEVTDVDPAPWLMEAYEAINGESPRISPSSEASKDRSGDYSPDDEWLTDELVEDALDHLHADCSYDQWRDLAFAVHDYDAGHGGKAIFESWSRGGSKFDENAKRLINSIWDSASQGSGVTVGTLVHLAKQEGWEPFDGRPSKPSYDVASGGDESGQEDGQETAETDGGAAAVSTSTESPEPDTRDVRTRLRGRAEKHVSDYQHDDDMEKSTVIHRTAMDILDELHFVYPPDDNLLGWRVTLYRYDPDEGVYVPDGKRYLGELAEDLLGDFLTNQQVRELVGRVKRLSGVDEEELEVPPNRLVVKNGILDLHTGELTDHTPHEHHRKKIDVAYRPDAECPRFDEFLHEIVKPGDVKTIYQLIAHTLYKDYVDEKAGMFVGDGSNGKTVLIDAICEFLGGHNVSHRSLQDLDGNAFAANSLEGKFANLVADMGDSTVYNLSTFKTLTGGDNVEADVKFEKSIKFKNHATAIFSANRIPAMKEDTNALWRRWIYINFPYTFGKEPDQKDPTPKHVLMRELTAEEEFEGLLARCVDETREWWDGREWFDSAMPADEVREKMKRASEPIYDFAMTCLEPADDEEWVSKQSVRQAYRDYAREEDLPTQPDNVFGERLLGIRDLPIESGQRREDGRRVTAYTGVRLSARGRQVLGLDELDDEDQETIDDGGPTGRMKDVVEAVRDLETDENAPTKDMVVGRACSSMNPRRAELAFEEAKKKGEIMQDGDGWRTTD